MILTLGYSKSVLAYLTAAARERSFTVVVAETSPSLTGHRTAAELAAVGLNVLLIADNSIVALLPKVSRVLIGAHAILAQGGALVPAGTRTLAAAATRRAKPLCLIVGSFKICPNFDRAIDPLPYLESALALSLPPGQVVNRTALEQVGLEIVAPQLDFLPPERISALITNSGGFPPSHVARLVRDQFDERDVRAVV